MDLPARPTRPHGWVAVATSQDGLSGAMVQLSCADPRAARARAVREFADLLAEQVRVRAPANLEELAGQDWIAGGPSAGWALERCADAVGAALAVERIARFQVPRGWVHGWTSPDGDGAVLLAAQSAGSAPRARIALSMLAAQIHEERAWEVVVGEHGPEELFDPFAVVDRPWRLDATSTVQVELERLLGAPWSLAGYAAFRAS